MDNFNEILTKSQKKFPSHKRISVCVKESPTNPFNSTEFQTIIHHSKDHPDYEIYIHTNYLTYASVSIPNFEPVRLPLDDKRWIELYLIFDVVKISNPKRDEAWWALRKSLGRY